MTKYTRPKAGKHFSKCRNIYRNFFLFKYFYGIIFKNCKYLHSIGNYDHLFMSPPADPSSSHATPPDKDDKSKQGDLHL